MIIILKTKPIHFYMLPTPVYYLSLIIFRSKTEADSSLRDYTTSAQLHTSLAKLKTNLIFDTYTTTAQLYDCFHIIIYIDNMLLTSTQTEALHYNKTDTGNLLANKITGIGDDSLPGMLDIGTSGYTNSRIRCNAEVTGHIGYGELRAASSYETFLNLSTTRTVVAGCISKLIMTTIYNYQVVVTK